MPANHPHIARRPIMVGGVRGYSPGDPVPPNVVADLGLLEGDHVAANPAYTPDAAPAAGRPDRGADKATWVAYAVAQGAKPAAAEAMTAEALAEQYAG
jgi:hypothetical protein